MRYEIVFNNGHRKEITSDDYAQMVEQMRQTNDSNVFFIAKNGLVNCEDITCVDEILEESGGGVITPKTPEQVQEERDREFAKVTMNPDNVIRNARGEE